MAVKQRQFGSAKKHFQIANKYCDKKLIKIFLFVLLVILQCFVGNLRSLSAYIWCLGPKFAHVLFKLLFASLDISFISSTRTWTSWSCSQCSSRWISSTCGTVSSLLRPGRETFHHHQLHFFTAINLDICIQYLARLLLLIVSAQQNCPILWWEKWR